MNTETDREAQWENEADKKRLRRSERQVKFEQEVAAMMNDKSQMAREILLIKKEIGRLHYKVKEQHNQSSIINSIVNTIVIAMLAIILYKMFSGGA